MMGMLDVVVVIQSIFSSKNLENLHLIWVPYFRPIDLLTAVWYVVSFVFRKEKNTYKKTIKQLPVVYRSAFFFCVFVQIVVN